MDHIKIGTLEWYKAELKDKDKRIISLVKQVEWLQKETAEINKLLQLK